MNILIVGEASDFLECKQKFGDLHAYSLAGDYHEVEERIAKQEVIFDFTISQDSERINLYSGYPACTIFVDAAKTGLKKLTGKSAALQHVFGFAGMPTFLNRNIFEVCLPGDGQREHLAKVCQKLKTSFQVVEDNVGLVTPRVICMIINEAYYTVEEGTATREDIDTAMKLGTNYPFGPFEWCQKIGIHHVCELLDAVYKDSTDERYKMSQLLTDEHLRN